MGHPNEKVLRKGYEAFAKGDLDTIRNEVFDPNIVFHIGGRSQLAGDYKGVDEVFGFLGRIMELSEGTFKAEAHAFLADDEHGVVLVNERAKRGNRTLDINTAHVFHLRDGKITEHWPSATDMYAEDEFWG